MQQQSPNDKAPAVFAAFDLIRIINLASRLDRRAEMIGELRRVGLEGDPRVAFFNACRFSEPGPFPSNGARGAYHSHMSVLEEAVRGGQSILIFEDDLDFVKGAEKYQMPKKWDIFYGGYEATCPDELQTSDIIGAHFIGFSAPAARTLLDYLKKSLANDGRGSTLFVDGAYVNGRREHPCLKTVFAIPKLGHQRPSRTDCGRERFYDRIPALRGLIHLARKTKRAVT